MSPLVLQITKGCYLVTSFVAVIPMLVGLVYEFYIAPLRSLDDQTPIYFFVQDWMMGLMYMQILYGLLLIGPETSAQRVVTEATRAGLLRMRMWPISKIVILPAVSIGVALALFPLLNQILVSKLLGKSDKKRVIDREEREAGSSSIYR